MVIIVKTVVPVNSLTAANNANAIACETLLRIVVQSIFLNIYLVVYASLENDSNDSNDDYCHELAV